MNLKTEDKAATIGTNYEKKKGRPNLITGDKLAKLVELYYTKKYSIRKLAQILGVSATTVMRTIKSTSAAQEVD